MRPREVDVVAVYGGTASGKTTVAHEIARRLSCTSLHCGERIRQKAAALGVSISSLSIEEHNRVDEETRSIVQLATGVMVVEGSFLDAVLSAVSRVYLVHLDCTDRERCRRFLARADGVTADAFEERDAHDRADRLRLYGDLTRESDLVVDNSAESAIVAADRICDGFNRLRRAST